MTRRLVPQPFLPKAVSRTALLAAIDEMAAGAIEMCGAMHPDECDEERERLAYERRVLRAVVEGRVKVGNTLRERLTLRDKGARR